MPHYKETLDAGYNKLMRHLNEIQYRVAQFEGYYASLTQTECNDAITELKSLYEPLQDMLNHISLQEQKITDLWEMISQLKEREAEQQEALKYLTEQCMGVQNPDYDDQEEDDYSEESRS